jgi:hypothetical protein
VPWPDVCADCRHEKTRALARELLDDRDTFWVVLDHPGLPSSNNDVCATYAGDLTVRQRSACETGELNGYREDALQTLHIPLPLRKKAACLLEGRG